jgi:Zn-dependent protease
MQRYTPRDILVLAVIALLFIYYFSPGALRDPAGLLIAVGAILVAITVHEFSHAFVAHRLGDPTPKLMGRVTLNPLKHLDPIGTIMLFIARFGWGKPVQFNPYNLRIDPAIGSALVSFAGPFANIVLATALTLPIRAGLQPGPLEQEIVGEMILINVRLAAFNLIPIPPLDGFGVLQGLLPGALGRALEPLREYGVFILLFLVFLPSLGGPDVLGMLMRPIERVIIAIVRGG